MDNYNGALKSMLKGHGYNAASAEDVYYPPYQAAAAHSAWTNWGPKSLVPMLTQVEYEK